MEITKARWEQAQAAERKYHLEDFHAGFAHYRDSYRQYFQYLNIDYDLQGKNIVEIGPADFPALAYCENLGKDCLIIEPMPSEYLKRFGLNISTALAEDADYKADEVWLMNVLQHVMDPYKIVERAKAQSNIVKFFEPINYGTNEAHPWNLTKQMFQEWFPGCVNYWPANQEVNNFHRWECVYGVWRKENV